MCLLRQLEGSLHVVETLLVLFYAILFVFLTFFACLLWRLNLLQQVFVSLQQLLSINLANFAQRNVWDLVFKTTVNIHAVVACPARVSETLNGVELVPLTRLGVVDFKRNDFANLVSSSSNDHH